MKIAADWLSAPGVQTICATLGAAGHQALLVGGCVRNALIGAPVHDIDIATDAPPDAVLALMRAAGLAVVPTGITHGTVTVLHHGTPHEVTTFRRDLATDGRHATVAWGDDVTEDAGRRDFTMNALYADAAGQVFDPLGTGLADLRARRVRFIEDPARRIREDYLRILRFFRFHAWYGDPAAGMDPDALAAIADHLGGLSGLSRERVGSEVMRLLAAPDPAPAVAAMRGCGVLMALLPGADDRALAVLVHLEQAQGVPADPLRRLASLGGHDLAETLRLSRADARRLALYRRETGSGAGPGALGYRLGAGAALDTLLLRAALMGQEVAPDDRAAARAGAAARFPLRAADLMPGLTGPALGRRLATLEEAWIASGFSLTRDQLLTLDPPD